MGNFRELNCWKESKAVAIEIIKLINNDSRFAKQFALKDQLSRSAISVPSNIAEGDELKTHRQGIKHFYIAKGSCAELITQLEIAKEVDVMDNEIADRLINKCNVISTMLLNLIKARAKFLNQ